ncbi:hypothetical protein SAMN05421858_2191 [Haladaptatus litoreus]|uniref:Uncharacterized protein n=1 Tax=Haladaptatus litoreus TaxID=553468 RepID=A0A1N6ZV79_9EURY|nr:hypothetical protein [Haladaptatus litoreus]SIR30758.1 hypothetical protein SAMN05421858_2191 [Haladaptatus litoreus]
MESRVSRRGVLSATAGLVSVGGIRTSGQQTNHIVVFGGSPRNVIEYAVTVSGRLEKSEESGGAPISGRHVTVDDEDTISRDGTHASGAIAGGGDAYRFTGRIVRFRVSSSASRTNDVSVFLNGRRVAPADLGDAPEADTPIEFLNCTTARVTGNFRSVRLHTSFWDEDGLGTNWLFDGPIRGTTLLNPRAEHEPYPFAIDSVSVDTRTLRTPGQAAKFTADNPFAGPWCRERSTPENSPTEQPPNGGLPNHLVIVGGVPRNPTRYEFVVGGQVEKTGDSGGAPIANRHVTIDRTDRISGRRVRGAVAGGGDAYRFSGQIERFRVGRGARVFLNGQRMNPDDFEMNQDNDEQPMNDGEPTENGDESTEGDSEPTEDDQGSRIEFFACDRARVTGEFERITISTTWYAPDGLATSYNEIGPVSGQTEIDESNVGDVAGVAGFAITEISAFEANATEPTISKRPPNLDTCLQEVRPDDGTETTSETTAEQGGSEQTTAATDESAPQTEQSDTTARQPETTAEPPEETSEPATEAPAPTTEQSPATEQSEPTPEPETDAVESGENETASGNESE